MADILRQETVGGVLMLIAAVVALLWANLAPVSYQAVAAPARSARSSLEHWAADGLLTIFFFVAGLELKRELTVGSLSKPAEALVPIVAALCGMVVPAAHLPRRSTSHSPTVGPRAGPIPMATDIAFALAILAVVGAKLPDQLCGPSCSPWPSSMILARSW